jgi:MFS family permease
MRPAAVALTGLAALAAAIGIGRFAFTPILPMMQEDAGVSVTAGGWLAAANYVGYLVGALSIVWLRIPAATAIRVGLLTIGVVTIGMGLVAGFVFWAVLRAIAGVASAWVLINASAWCLERLAPLRSPLLNGTVFAGVGVGIALTGAVCLGLMFVHASAAEAWIVIGAIALVLAASIWAAFGVGDRQPSRDADAYRRSRAWGRGWTRLVLCYGAFGFGYIIPATFLPLMAKQVIRNPAVFGWSWPVFGAAAAVSAVALGLLPRTTNRRAWIVGHLLMACGIALPAIWPGILAIMVAALAVGGTFMVITMVGLQEAREAGGADATRLMAALTAAFGLGQILGPLLVSGLAGHGRGFSPALLIAASVLAISAYVLSRAER